MNEEIRKKAEKIMENQNVCYAYFYPNNGGKRQEFVFEMNPENIANFLGMHFLDASKIILTDVLDSLILDTFGGFINYCCDQQLNIKIVNLLIPIQCGEKEAEKFPMITMEEWNEYGNSFGF